MKKIISIVLILTMLMGSAVFADTTNKTDVYKIDEYSMFKQLKDKSDQELLNAGLTSNEIVEIRNFKFSDEFSARAKMSQNELLSMGYSKEQIVELRKIFNTPTIANASDEEINSLIMTRGLFADLTIATNFYSGSDSYISVSFSWSWSNLPAYYGNKDIFAVDWAASDSGGYPLNTILNQNTTYSYIEFYENNNQLGNSWSSKYSWDVENQYENAYKKFQLGYNIDGMIGWYQYGRGKVRIERIGTAAIKEIALLFKYGHTTIVGVPSVSFPTGLSINFGIITTEMDLDSKRFNKYGEI